MQTLIQSAASRSSTLENYHFKTDYDDLFYPSTCNFPSDDGFDEGYIKLNYIFLYLWNDAYSENSHENNLTIILSATL